MHCKDVTSKNGWRIVIEPSAVLGAANGDASTSRGILVRHIREERLSPAIGPIRGVVETVSVVQ
jgi:hypothetical protein